MISENGHFLLMHLAYLTSLELFIIIVIPRTISVGEDIRASSLMITILIFM
jgi:hypothetical protein